MEIVLIIVLILFFYELQYRLYAKHCFKNLSLEFEFKDEAIFEGEQTKIKQTFTNRKWLPLWWLRIQYMMSSNISFDQVEEKKISNLERRSEELSLLGYEKLEREVTIIGNKRGYYKLENMDIICSDLFVTDKFVKKHYVNEGLYVFPKILSELQYDIQFKKLLGDVITKRHLIYDPYERSGIRDYVTSDSLKDVNWSASARSSELKVNVYNYTASQEILIFLSCQKENEWVQDNVVEEGIRIAATIYDEFSKQGIKVGLITDSIDSDTGSNILVSAGCEQDQGILFNESLARILITKSDENNISNYINEEVIRDNREPLWIVISNATRNGMREAVQNARENDFDVKWIIPKERNTEILLENLNEVLIWDVS
jgi:uncharacterized protein (DUF58 family)